MSALPSIDFTCAWSAFQKHDLSVYPDCVRPTVERIRMLAQSQLTILEDQKLGFGQYGEVYKGFYENLEGTKFICAVKIFKNENYSEYCHDEGYSLWNVAGTPHVVGFHGFKAHNTQDINCIILDFIEGSTIAPPIISSHQLFRTEVTELARQFFTFLAVFQKPAPNRTGVAIHGDLSTNNVFWHNQKLTVIDFGLARVSGLSRDPIIQSKLFRAPEIWLNQMSEDENVVAEKVNYTERIDIWSVGVIIHEFVTGNSFIFNRDPPISYGHHEISVLTQRIGMPPASYLESVVATDKFFEKTKENGFVLKPEIAKLPKRKSIDETYRECPQLFPEICDLLKKILVWDPAERITPEAALKHQLFLQTQA